MTKTSYKNIAISGDISTGKSTLARNLSAKLGWRHISGGDYIREWFKEHNLPLEEADKVPEEIDRQLDMGLGQKMKNDKHVIFESKLAGWLSKDFPDVLKVLCITDDEVRMKRAAKRDGVSLTDSKKNSQKRARLVKIKFKKLYGVTDSFNPKYFDLVVDTTIKNPEEVMEEVLTFAKLSPDTL